MSLNYDLRTCDPVIRTEEMSDRTTAVVFSMMSVHMRELTEDNIKTYCQRMIAWSKVYGPYFRRVVDGGFVDYTMTTEDMKPYVGLKVNVTEKTNVQFKNHLAKALMDESMREVK